MRRRWGAALGAAGVLLAGSAHAAVITQTWTGKVSRSDCGPGVDVIGILDCVLGTVSVGQDFTAVLTYDTSLGSLRAFPTSAGSGVALAGGTNEPAPYRAFSSPGTGSLTIGGHTVNFDSSHGSGLFAQDKAPGDVEYGGDIFGDEGALKIFTDGLDNPGVSLNTPYSGAVCDIGCTASAPRMILAPTHLEVTISGSFDNPTPSAAPEPASWALMLLGFGLAGAALRRPDPGSREPGVRSAAS